MLLSLSIHGQTTANSSLLESKLNDYKSVYSWQFSNSISKDILLNSPLENKNQQPLLLSDLKLFPESHFANYSEGFLMVNKDIDIKPIPYNAIDCGYLEDGISQNLSGQDVMVSNVLNNFLNNILLEGIFNKD